MQSKFWAAGSETSESDFSSSDSDDGRDNETQKRATVASRWATAESSSSEDEGRVVKSLKDRRWFAMREIIRQMENHIKISDFSQLYKDYDQLIKAFHKSNQIVLTDGIPNFFIRALVDLESYIEEKYKDRESFKKLSKAKALALNTLRAKVRKANESWASKVEECKANRQDFESSDEESVDDLDSDSEFSDDSLKEEDESEATSSSSSPEGSSEDASDWSDSDGEQASSGDEVDRHKVAMAKWGIREEGAVKKPKQSSTKKKVTVSSSRTKEKVSKDAPAAENVFSVKDMENLFDTNDLSIDAMRKRVQVVVERRGRRGVDKHEQTNILKKLAEIAELVGPQCHLEVMGYLIGAEFDTISSAFTCLSPSIWIETYTNVCNVLSILESHPESYLTSVISSDDTAVEKNIDLISTSILASFVDRLDEELSKSLQYTDVHSDEYKERLSHTMDMLALLWRAFYYVDKRSPSLKAQAASIALKINEHMHYKHDTIALRMWELARKNLSEEQANELPSNDSLPSLFVERLTRYIFLHSDSKREKTRALLHVAYTKSLHDYYYDARDLLHTPNIQEVASQIDISTQILYNRNLLQLGLCAFRLGLISDAHACLSQICPKHKELLAQGLSNLKNVDRTLEQERAEKRRLLPYHMHISMELIEGAYNICAMLLEVPQMAKESVDTRKRIITKHFRRMLEAYIRQPFQGPPENARETVMAATKALQRGDWQDCAKYIFSLNIWDKMLNREAIQDMIKQRIKREAMRTYILTYLAFYDSFSTEQLSSMFELSKNDVHSIVSKMMINEEIHASWDESSRYIILSRMDNTRLQQLALTLSENVSNSVEQNELTLNMKNPKFALTHERRFQMREAGDRYSWGHRDREEGNFRGRRHRGRGFINPVGGRGGRGGARGGRGRYAGQNYGDSNRDDNAMFKFGTAITYA